MEETPWKKIAAVSALVFLLIGLCVADWKGLEAIQRLKDEVGGLKAQVVELNRVAHEEASAASAASQRANDAALRADAAANGRLQAEQKSQQAEQKSQEAEAGRTQALSSAQQATEAATKANEELARLHREREQELNNMQEALNRVVETHRTAQGMVIVLPDSTFRFDFDKADLSAKNRELLSRVAGILLVSKGYGLSVFGYTDDVGSDEYNQQLSLRRAEAVQRYLVQSGIDPAIINRKGYGKSSPVSSSSAAAARAKNRRVEIAVTDSSIKYGGEATPAK